MISALIANIVYVFIGYAVCVLFPLPWLSSAVLDFWSAFGSKIVSFFKGVETTVVDDVKPVAPVVTPAPVPVSNSTDSDTTDIV